MAATRTWDETTPAGSSNVSAGDDSIRNFKVDVRERMALDHVWNVDQATDGFHKQLTMPVQSDPTQVASAVLVYSKDVSAKAELHVRDEDGDIVQLTDGGLHALLGINSAWTKGQAVAEVTLTDQATITIDAALSNSFKVTLAASRTLAVPTNGKSGQTISIRFIQDGGGGNTITMNSSYKKVSGLPLVLSTTGSKQDLMVMYYDGSVWSVQALNVDIKASV